MQSLQLFLVFIELEVMLVILPVMIPEEYSYCTHQRLSVDSLFYQSLTEMSGPVRNVSALVLDPGCFLLF